MERSRFTISMSEELKKRIELIAIEEGRSVAKQIEKICEVYVRECDHNRKRKT